MNKFIKYDSGTHENENWVITEKEFNFTNQGKFETIFSLGNGYIGTRAHLEEEYPNRHPGAYVAGTFNKVQGPEVSELPNMADLWSAKITLDDEEFNMLSGEISNYRRELNLRNATLTRELDWRSPKGKEYHLVFERFTSMHDLHVMGQKIKVTPKENMTIKSVSGINGQQSNSGAQHFEDYYSSYKENILNYIFKTTASNIYFFINKKININVEGESDKSTSTLQSVYGYNRRKLQQVDEVTVTAGKTVLYEMISTIHTTRDKDISSNSKPMELNKQFISQLEEKAKDGYCKNHKHHEATWEKLWKEWSIDIKTDNVEDIIAIRFALYHMRRFTPLHDNRFNIEAKGFAGEEYKGHTFWDTEIYIWPYYLATNPKYARQLLEHRYFVKKSAQIKAKENGFDGYMWPWETTWIEDGESCPTWGAVDRIEGERIKVWPAYNQLHIGGCIIWAVVQYFLTTKDKNFMEKYGYEMIFGTADFWASRLEYKEDLDRYEITKVTGPNEYKENINNNAFTNYMAWFIIDNAIKYAKEDNSLIEKFKLSSKIKGWEEKVSKIYKPEPNENGIIPENDSFLQLKELDTVFYKKNPDQLWKDYTFPQLNDYQVLKQADIVALFYMLPEKFDQKTIVKNWEYYEKRTLHHSSLSLSLHSVTANWGTDKELSYRLWEKASMLDLGPNMNSCDNGIHAANVGGTTKMVIEGFGGIKFIQGKLIIDPNLPKQWESLKFNFEHQGSKITYYLTKNFIELEINSDKFIEVEVDGKKWIVEGKTKIEYGT